MFCFCGSLLKWQKVLLCDEDQSVKPEGAHTEVARDRADVREEQPLAAGSPGSCQVEVLPLCHGWCGTPLCPHQAPLKNSPFKHDRKVRRWCRTVRKWLQQGICGPGVSEKGSALAACQWRRFWFTKGWFWGTKALVGNMPAPLHPGLTSWAAPGRLAGIPNKAAWRLADLWHFAFPVIWLQSCTYPWARQAPRNLCPPGWWAMSCLGFLAPWGLGCCPLSATIPARSCICVGVYDTPHGVFQRVVF